MPIVLGNTSISGLGVGGLPNGVVTSATLANSSVTRDKIGYNGQILQTIVTQDSGQTTVQNNDTAKLTTSITPTSASSRILIRASIFSAFDNGNGYWGIQRNGSNIGGRMWGIEDAWPAQPYDTAPLFLQLLDSPNTTSAVTYRVYYTHEGRNGGTTYWNRGRIATYGATLSTLVLMEIS
jgi:hypothetical protein